MSYLFDMSIKELYEARHEPENLRPIAEAYWRALLLVALSAVAGTILFGVWEFSNVMEKITAQGAVANAPINNVLDRTQLQKAIADFDGRMATFESARIVVSTSTDPSVK